MSVRNALVLLFVVSMLALLVGCGGSSASPATPPPSGAFGDTNFSGTYTFSVSGQDVNGIFAMAGSFVACGCSPGTISSGAVDFDDPTGFAPAAAIGSNSTYSINSDGRGLAKLQITPTGGTVFEVDIDFVLTSGSHGLIIRYDGNGTGSGTIDSQASAFSLGTTPYAFIISGSDLNDNPLATAGAFTLASGAISTGVADFNYGATPSTELALTGTVSVGTGTAPGTAVLTTSFSTQPLTFDVYAIDSTHLKVVESDGAAILVGDVFTQSSASIPAETLVFTMEGLDTGGNVFAAGGLMTSDGTSLIPSGSEDLNDAGLVDNGTTPATPYAFSGSFLATGGGRFSLNLTNFVGGAAFAAYPSDGGLLMLEVDTGLNAGVTSGIALAQAPGAALTASQGYGMSLTGEDVLNGVELDEIGEFKTTSSAFTNGLLDENDNGPENPQNLTGSYTPGTNGTGSATLSSGLQAMFYYAADSSTALFISNDPNEASAGSLEVQSTPTGGSQSPAQARPLPMLRTMPRPNSASRKPKTFFHLTK